MRRCSGAWARRAWAPPGGHPSAEISLSGGGGRGRGRGCESESLELRPPGRSLRGAGPGLWSAPPPRGRCREERRAAGPGGACRGAGRGAEAAERGPAMGFLHQLQLLLWKNVTLKRRSPVSDPRPSPGARRPRTRFAGALPACTCSARRAQTPGRAPSETLSPARCFRGLPGFGQRLRLCPRPLTLATLARSAESRAGALRSALWQAGVGAGGP